MLFDQIDPLRLGRTRQVRASPRPRVLVAGVEEAWARAVTLDVAERAVPGGVQAGMIAGAVFVAAATLRPAHTAGWDGGAVVPRHVCVLGLDAEACWIGRWRRDRRRAVAGYVTP